MYSLEVETQETILRFLLSIAIIVPIFFISNFLHLVYFLFIINDNNYNFLIN